MAALYDGARVAGGFVPNYVRAFSHAPEVYAAWIGLSGAIRGRMDPRRYELVAVAAALELRNSYCALAHGAVLLRDGFSPAELEAIVRDRNSAELAPAEVAVMDFAAAVARDAAAIGEAEVAALRAHGLTDGDIADVAAAAAVRCFFSKYLDAVGAAPDASYAGIEPALRQALTVGRPIDAGPTDAATEA